jgi:NAD(P)-dependent dehydrogenase (short-subunit alcohol dehydrogenase family)
MKRRLERALTRPADQLLHDQNDRHHWQQENSRASDVERDKPGHLANRTPPGVEARNFELMAEQPGASARARQRQQLPNGVRSIINFRPTAPICNDPLISCDYSAARACTNSLTRGFAGGYARDGIQMDAIVPGFIFRKEPGEARGAWPA